MAAEPDDALIDRIAAATSRYPFKVWGFGESIAMEGLLAAGGRHRRFAAGLLDQWAATAPPIASDPLAHVAPGVPLLTRFRQTGNPIHLQRANELAGVLTGMAVGRAGARIHRPDLTGWEHEVWVDCMHLDGPFLAEMAALTGNDALFDDAADLLLTHARVLQDEASGLFSHGFDDATGEPNRRYWGRGQGWALLGLVDTLHALPLSHPAREEIGRRLGLLVSALAATERRSGRWATVVDEAATYLEPSVSAFVALGAGRAVRHGLVGAMYRDLVDRAWGAVAAHLAPDGTLPGVSDATPVGATAEHYGTRPTGVFPWGQGPALLTAIERRTASP